MNVWLEKFYQRERDRGVASNDDTRRIRLRAGARPEDGAPEWGREMVAEHGQGVVTVEIAVGHAPVLTAAKASGGKAVGVAPIGIPVDGDIAVETDDPAVFLRRLAADGVPGGGRIGQVAADLTAVLRPEDFVASIRDAAVACLSDGGALNLRVLGGDVAAAVRALPPRTSVTESGGNAVTLTVTVDAHGNVNGNGPDGGIRPTGKKQTVKAATAIPTESGTSSKATLGHGGPIPSAYLFSLLTLCSGIGAAEVAAKRLRCTTALVACEIAKGPATVLAARFPDEPNVGNMLSPDIIAKIRAASRKAVDVVFASTPCQAFSIAGLRLGLADERGKLTPEAARIFEFLAASIFIWENVLGALTEKSNAFGCLIQLLCGGHADILPPKKSWPKAGIAVGPRGTLAWRVLNSQHYGVPQRRRRIFLVFCTHESGIDPSSIVFDFPGGGSMRYADQPKGEAAVSAGGVDVWTVDRKGRLPGDNAPHAGEAPLAAPPACDIRDILHKTQVPERYWQPAQGALGIRNRAAVGGKPVGLALARALDESMAVDAIKLLAKERKDRDRALAKAKKPIREIEEKAACRLLRLRDSLLAYLDPANRDAAFADAKGERDIVYTRQSHSSHCRATVSSTLMARNGRPPLDLVVSVRDTGDGASAASVPAGIAEMPIDSLAALAEAEVRRTGRHFVARRYTPVECLRLMGFDDDHCMVPSGNPPKKLSEKDARQLIALHAAEGRHYTREQLASFSSDADQYMAAGNSIAIPCALRILSAAAAAMAPAEERVAA